MTSVKLGIRNLARNRWRSGLTLAAIAVAVGLMVWTIAMYEGWITQMVRGATAVEIAQVQVQTAGYVESSRIYESFPLTNEMVAQIRGVSGVVALSPRIKANGLLGNEQRSQVVRLLGVDPAMEAATTPVRDGLIEGRWLADEPAADPAPREVVVGSGVAQQLRVGIGDELVAILEAADGSLGNDLFVVVGVVRTGNTAIDRMAAYLHLTDAQFITALDGQVHEISVATADLTAARATADSVAQAIGAVAIATDDAATMDEDQIVVRPWQEIVPAIDQMILLFRRSYWFMYLVLYLIAAIGILNTQRMSALERRREFGVMMAIGMRPRRMFGTLQVETTVLGMLGALVGAVLGGLLSWYHATVGLNLSMFTDSGSFSYMGVAFSDRLMFELAPHMVIQPVLVMIGVALVSGLLPAWKSARIDPAPTISGRV
jgi:ABC-type lipoprotein release transport system permease subunit